MKVSISTASITEVSGHRGIERGRRKCFMVVVPHRRVETLLPIIERCIRPRTIIVSDGWRAYRNIDQLAEGTYEHWVVFHRQNFVHPGDPEVHTQNVENMWMRSKRKLKRQFGTSDALFPSYLDEFMWRNKTVSKKSIYQCFYNTINIYYRLL